MSDQIKGSMLKEQSVEAIELGLAVSTVDYLDALMYCYSPAHQLSTYYRHGSVDLCDAAMEDFKRAMKLKMNYTAEEKQRFLSELNHTGEGDLWKLRAAPSSGWGFSDC